VVESLEEKLKRPRGIRRKFSRRTGG